jgi:2-amino-4-hydroxy-6-hydroxymethyldihydropteridine diphosphokinase
MDEDHVFLGIGGNLPSKTIGSPLAVMAATLRALPSVGIVVRHRSRWYRSAALPPSDQPTYINGVLDVETSLAPEPLLEALHRVEAEFGRVRGAPNAARVLDLDLLAFGRMVVQSDAGLCIPHPRMHLRAFVLEPLAELAPDWRHPRLGLSVRQMVAALPAGQWVEPLDAGLDEAAAGLPDLPSAGGLA